MAVRDTVDAVSWGQLLSASAEIFDRYRFFYYPIPTAESAEWVKSFSTLVLLASSIREYTIASKEDLIAAWDQLREDQMLLDLIISVTGDLLVETNWSPRDLAVKLADAISLPTKIGGSSVIDEAFQGSLGNRSELTSIFADNPWFMTLCLLRRSGKLNLTRPVSPPAEAAA